MNETTNIIEAVIAAGDLSRLSVDQRNTYYVTVCQSIGLNPLTRPFEYITLNGKLTLYARKDATDQLRSIKGVSITRADVSLADSDWVIVTTEARDATGRTDIDVGCVSRKDMRGDLGNVIMKAVTKSKRRVTLSLCGLGMLDESEIETIPDAKPFVATTPQLAIAAPSRLLAETHDLVSRAQHALESDMPQNARDALVIGLDHARVAIDAKNQDAMRLACDELRRLVPPIPGVQIPAAPEWKTELIALGTRAKQAAVIMTPEEQQIVSAALDMAREVLKRNGHSTQEERDAATSALKQALGE